MRHALVCLVGAGLLATFPGLAPAAAEGSAPSPTPGAIWWRAPAADTIAWRGQLETAGGSVGMGTQIGLYPVAGAGGLIAAVLTHALISQSAQTAEQQRAQEAADKVLAPFQPALQAWTAAQLWAESAQQVASVRVWSEAGPAPGASLETVPIFSLNQDSSALQLDVAVKWTPAPNLPAQELAVRVVSAPQAGSTASANWQAGDLQPLKTTAASLLAQAVDLVVRHAATPPAPETMRTYRYQHGQAERAERAERLGGDCSRAVLRNLRGWLLSVPLPNATRAACEAPGTVPAAVPAKAPSP